MSHPIEENARKSFNNTMFSLAISFTDGLIFWKQHQTCHSILRWMTKQKIVLWYIQPHWMIQKCMRVDSKQLINAKFLSRDITINEHDSQSLWMLCSAHIDPKKILAVYLRLILIVIESKKNSFVNSMFIRHRATIELWVPMFDKNDIDEWVSCEF